MGPEPRLQPHLHEKPEQQQGLVQRNVPKHWLGPEWQQGFQRPCLFVMLRPGFSAVAAFSLALAAELAQRLAWRCMRWAWAASLVGAQEAAPGLEEVPRAVGREGQDHRQMVAVAPPLRRSQLDTDSVHLCWRRPAAENRVCCSRLSS